MMSNISTATLTGNIKDTTTITGHLDYPVISGTKEITSNGTYDISKYQEVNVNTPQPSGDITINENGTYNVLEYENAIVNIPSPTGTLEITSNGEYNVTNYEKANVNTPGYTLLYSTEKTVKWSENYTNNIISVNLGSDIWTSNSIIYVKVRDKAGARQGYFCGSDTFFINKNPANEETSYSTSEALRNYVWYNALNKYIQNATTGSYVYGVCGERITNYGNLSITARYHPSYSATIDGTYTIKVYKLDYPDGISPFI